MITTKVLCDWLQGSGTAVHLIPGLDMPDKPDRLGMVSRGPGGRAGEHEGTLDRGTFTIRFRGLPTDQEMPELDAHHLRLWVERTPVPVELGVQSLWPSGPPYPLPGPDSGRRYESVATYMYLVSTDI